MTMMDIIYLGHSSFKLKGKTGTLITDPFDPKMVGIKFVKTSADIVTLSHSHSDHNQSNLISDTRMVIDGPGEYEVVGISIIGIPSFHDDKKGEERGNNIIFVIEMDGLRIVHLGDLGHELSESVINHVGTVDILMVPVGGFYTVDAEKAASVVRSIEPSIVIPMHYLTPGLNPERFGKLQKVEEFLTATGLPVEKMDKLSLKKSDISEESKKIVLLEIKN